MRLTVRVLGLDLIDLSLTTDEPPSDAPVGDTGTYLSVGFKPTHQDPDRPTWPYEEEEKHGTRRLS